MTSSDICSSRRPLGACVVEGAGVALGILLELGACALVGLGVALGVAAAVPAGAPVTVPGGAGVLLGSGGTAAATDASGTDAALATAARYLRRAAHHQQKAIRYALLGLHGKTSWCLEEGSAGSAFLASRMSCCPVHCRPF